MCLNLASSSNEHVSHSKSISALEYMIAQLNRDMMQCKTKATNNVMKVVTTEELTKKRKETLKNKGENLSASK